MVVVKKRRLILACIGILDACFLWAFQPQKVVGGLGTTTQFGDINIYAHIKVPYKVTEKHHVKNYKFVDCKAVHMFRLVLHIAIVSCKLYELVIILQYRTKLFNR